MNWRSLLVAVLVCLLTACGQPPQTPRQTAISLLSLPAADGFARAERPREFSFPRDHGRHSGYRTEWWYITGNLQAQDRRLGYQVTFFRFLLDPAEDAQLPWESDAIWLAQAAVSDPRSGQFLTSERLSRELTGLTGSATESLDVYATGWRLWQPAAGEPYELRINAAQFELQLTLQSEKPVVLQGEQGLSRKSAADPLNASYYYSQTRLVTHGNVQLGDQSLAVQGASWFDREWSTSALHARQAGWDWFALQLDNGCELMFYQLRLQDGSADRASAGVWVGQQGEVKRLSSAQVGLTPIRFWTSPDTGKRYPVAWQMQIADLGLRLQVSAVMPDQEWQGRFIYWEGAVDVTATDPAGRSLGGHGYLELTGY